MEKRSGKDDSNPYRKAQNIASCFAATGIINGNSVAILYKSPFHFFSKQPNSKAFFMLRKYL